MDKVLIFGISGFVGKYLSQEFINNGYAVYGSDKVCGENIPTEVLFYSSDLLDAVGIERLIHEIKPNIIINLAAISSVGKSWGMPQTTIMINVVGAINIMEAARKLKIKPKIMFIGSSEEYSSSDNPIDENYDLNANNPYGISKVTQERFAQLYRERYNMKIYCVRPFNHTGIGQHESFVLPSFCKQVAEIELSGRPGVIKVGNMAARRDFSHVRDIVRAYRMIVESDNYQKIYNVGYGKAYGLSELLNYIINLSHQKICVEVDEERVRPVDNPVICCDRNLITKDLGWNPEYTVFDALDEMYFNYVMKNGKN